MYVFSTVFYVLVS